MVRIRRLELPLLLGTTTSTLRVYQFHHIRIKKLIIVIKIKNNKKVVFNNNYLTIGEKKMNNIFGFFSLLFVVLNVSKAASIICYGYVLHTYINKSDFKNKETLIVFIADIFFYEIFMLSFVAKQCVYTLILNDKYSKTLNDIFFYITQAILIILINETRGVKIDKSTIILPYIISIALSLIKDRKNGRSK